MAGEQTGEEQRGERAELQKMDAGIEAHDKGNTEGQQSEQHALPAVFLHASHVQLQAGKEHDIIDAHLPEQLKAAVSFQQVESIFSHQNAGNNQSHHIGNVQAVQQYGGKQDDGQYQEKNPGRVRD